MLTSSFLLFELGCYGYLEGVVSVCRSSCVVSACVVVLVCLCLLLSLFSLSCCLLFVVFIFMLLFCLIDRLYLFLLFVTNHSSLFRIIDSIENLLENKNYVCMVALGLWVFHLAELLILYRFHCRGVLSCVYVWSRLLLFTRYPCVSYLIRHFSFISVLVPADLDLGQSGD